MFGLVSICNYYTCSIDVYCRIISDYVPIQLHVFGMGHRDSQLPIHQTVFTLFSLLHFKQILTVLNDSII